MGGFPEDTPRTAEYAINLGHIKLIQTYRKITYQFIYRPFNLIIEKIKGLEREIIK